MDAVQMQIGGRAVRRNALIAMVGLVVTVVAASVSSGRTSQNAAGVGTADAPAAIIVRDENGPTGYFPDQFDASKATRVQQHVEAF